MDWTFFGQLKMFGKKINLPPFTSSTQLEGGSLERFRPALFCPVDDATQFGRRRVWSGRRRRSLCNRLPAHWIRFRRQINAALVRHCAGGRTRNRCGFQMGSPAPNNDNNLCATKAFISSGGCCCCCCGRNIRLLLRRGILDGDFSRVTCAPVLATKSAVWEAARRLRGKQTKALNSRTAANRRARLLPLAARVVCAF